MNHRKFDKVAFFLPNIFTALNMACGFFAIMLSMQGEFYKACMFIILGSIFDSVDGRVARLTGTQSLFGEQFDSLSDLISFGIAPAMIYYNRFLIDLGRVGMVVTFIYLLCGALRLARFNANISKVSSNFFQGLPIPGAAIAVLGAVFVSLNFDNPTSYVFLTIPYIIFYALLMISNIPFPSFKGSPWVREHRKQALFIIFILISTLFIYEEIMIPIIITCYIFFSILYAIKNRKEMSDIFAWADEEEEQITQASNHSSAKS